MTHDTHRLGVDRVRGEEKRGERRQFDGRGGAEAKQLPAPHATLARDAEQDADGSVQEYVHGMVADGVQSAHQVVQPGGKMTEC